MVGEMELWDPYLVGGFKKIETYARQIGSFPQVGVNIKHIWNHHLVMKALINGVTGVK